VNSTEQTFLTNTVLAAQQAQRQFGIPACITIAQATLESGWGQSALARQANNYFGVKANAKATPAQYAEFPTEEFVDGRKVEEMARFARYSTPAAGFEAHAYLLNMALRYRPAMAVKNDPAKFAQALQDCGYSTNPNYAALLMKLVREFDLEQYDILPGSPAQTKEAKG
jgi:flagellum-specific peptidoglycan hydrolase FlgJ